MTIAITTTAPERRDRSWEAWLNSFGIDHAELTALPIDRIDVAKSHANQARLGEPVIAELVAKYQRALDAGAIFPPIIVAANGVVIDGNNRVAAHIAAGEATIWAYVVDVNEARFRELAYSANSVMNGEKNSDAALAAHAVHLYGTGGYNFDSLGSKLGLSAGQVSDIVHAESVKARVKRPSLTSKLPRTVLATLDSIVADEHLIRAVELAVEVDMTGAQVRSLVSQIKKARSIEDGNTAISAAAERLVAAKADRRKQKRPTSDMAAFGRGVGNLLLINPTRLALSVNGSASHILEQLEEVEALIGRLREALSK